jgi:AbiJ-like protein
MPFSERMGLKPARAVMQLDDIDEPLRTALYNLLYADTAARWYEEDGDYGIGREIGCHIWTEYLRLPVDTFSDSPDNFATTLREYIGVRPWYEVYDLIEFRASVRHPRLDENRVNKVLERDMSGYRLRAGNIVQITDEVELSAIDDVLAATDKFKSARDHIREALAKLARRPNPDLRNAITEAVSAVESAARIVSGKPKATLADALKVLEKGGHVHPALKESWLKLYGYTSDEHGLRHAMTQDPNIDFATAKYMVVSCCAFVNLLSASL